MLHKYITTHRKEDMPLPEGVQGYIIIIDLDIYCNT